MASLARGDGFTVEVSQEVEYVHTLSPYPDPRWSIKHSCGLAISNNFGLTRVVDEWWDPSSCEDGCCDADDEPYPAKVHYECMRCGETVERGMTTAPFAVRGMIETTLKIEDELTMGLRRERTISLTEEELDWIRVDYSRDTMLLIAQEAEERGRCVASVMNIC